MCVIVCVCFVGFDRREIAVRPSKGKGGESVKLAASCSVSSERENKQKKTQKNMFVHVNDRLTGPFSCHLSQS